MAELGIEEQNLVKARDRYFEKALNSNNGNEKLSALFEAMCLSKKLKKPSDNFAIWIEPQNFELDEDGDEIRRLHRVF